MIIEARARLYRLQVMKIYPKMLFMFNSVTTCRLPRYLLSFTQYQKHKYSDFTASFKRVSWAYTQDSQESQNCLGWRRPSRSNFFLFRSQIPMTLKLFTSKYSTKHEVQKHIHFTGYLPAQILIFQLQEKSLCKRATTFPKQSKPSPIYSTLRAAVVCTDFCTAGLYPGTCITLE